MTAEPTFADLIARVRAGDAAAAAEVIRRYETELRCEVRVRLRRSALRRLVDSADVCQSVLASFFVRAAAGQYDLDRPENVLRLLLTMARNKVANLVKHQLRQRRDVRRAVGLEAAGAVAAAGPGPEQQAEILDLLGQLRRRLTPEELRLAELRSQGFGWAEIARALGGTADARRVQLSRAVDRVAAEFDLPEGAEP